MKRAYVCIKVTNKGMDCIYRTVKYMTHVFDITKPTKKKERIQGGVLQEIFQEAMLLYYTTMPPGGMFSKAVPFQSAATKV